jgi:hypothetical protein
MAAPWWKGMSAGAIGTEVYAAARALFAAPEWLTFEELPIPGSRGGRRADLIALSIWGPTRAVVCELKASRSDFLAEIRNPDKRAAGVAFGTEFTFILPHGMVQPDEVPEGCGLYEVQRNRRIRRTKIGTQRTGIDWTPAMFHAMIKAIAYRHDPVLRTFSDAGNDGAPAYRALFRALGAEWTLDELLDLARTLHRARSFTAAEVEAARYDYEERKRRDPEVLRLHELARTVHRLCGWGTADPERFARWHAEQGVVRGMREDLRELRNAHRLLGSILERAEQATKGAEAPERTRP